MNCLKMCRHKKLIGLPCAIVLVLALCLNYAGGQLVLRKAEDVLPSKILPIEEAARFTEANSLRTLPRQLSHLQQTQILSDIQQHHTSKPPLEDTTPTVSHPRPPRVVSAPAPPHAHVITQNNFLVPQLPYQHRPQLVAQESQHNVVKAEAATGITEAQRTAEAYLHLSNGRHQLFKQIENKTQHAQKQLNPKPQQNQQYLQEQLHKQFTQQLLQRQDLLRKLKQAISESVTPTNDEQTSEPSNSISQNENGGQVSLESSGSNVVQSVSLAQTTTARPWKMTFEEISKGVLPKGAQYEVIRHNEGGLEDVGKIPTNLPGKNVTFVFLEEQSDGTFKVQGIKGNNNTDQSGGDVSSIIKKIQDGDLKLPPSTTLGQTPAAVPTTKDVSLASLPTEIFQLPKSYLPKNRIEKSTTTQNLGNEQRASEVQPTAVYSQNPWFPTPNAPVASQPLPPRPPVKPGNILLSLSTSTSPKASKTPVKTVRPAFLPTVQTFPGSPADNYVSIRSASRVKNITKQATVQQTQYVQSSVTPEQQDDQILQRPYRRLPAKDSGNSTDHGPANGPNQLTSVTLGDVLKEKGLFAMAKFLKESGLENVLYNKDFVVPEDSGIKLLPDTIMKLEIRPLGPYTLFAPTDKAFRALFVQLGGPEKAASKFRENPRLLSGLLLHHIIPGAFRIDSLINEMTGVSLAGTQLRVNTYASQDGKWNDLQIVTINGARVMPENQDIPLPQGIAHAIDRVMFPLPVGDLVLTLQSDRAKRFTKFLRAMKSARISDLVTSSSSVTLFAPTDDAFSVIADDDAERLMTDMEMARALVLRHITPGALYSAGMRYYQERQSMLDEQPITVFKNEGQVRVNTASVVTYNTPATNGVIHAINGLL